MLSASNIHFEMAERGRAVNYGGIGAIHLMGQRLGLAEEIDGRVQLLERHLPYHESGHVLNLAYSALWMASGWKISNCGVTLRLFWMAWARNAFRIRQPVEITRRFDREAIVDLMDAINSTRQRAWKKQPRGFLSHAFIDPMAP
jgi:hypothetical protein